MKIKWALLSLALLGCQTTNSSKTASFDQKLNPKNKYMADIKWSEFQAKLPENSNKNCAYHIVDFDLNTDGSPVNARISDYSLEAFSQFSLEAAKKWTFYNPFGSSKKGRMAFVYSSYDKNVIYLMNPELKVSYSNQLDKQSTKIPKLVRRVDPKMPREAFKSGISGTAVARYTINVDGSVSKVEIISALPPGVFDRATESAIKQWKFETIDEPQESEVTLSFQSENQSGCVF